MKTFEEARDFCHVRSAIYQASNPDKKYWKNNFLTLDEQVPEPLKKMNDWLEYDPQDEEPYHIPA